MNWKKRGLIFAPSGEWWWARSYAHLPTVDVVDDNILRVYFASLDENKYGRIGYVDLDANNPCQILSVTPEPILDLGELGTFDDCGVVPSCVVTRDNLKYLYYIGFQRMERVPYMLFTGLATSHDSGRTWTKYARTPVLDRTIDEPFSRSAPFVLLDDSALKMWYWSCLQWTQDTRGVHYNNVIKFATSDDGTRWQSSDVICLRPESADEYSIGRPCVLHDEERYRMWYSIRSFKDLYSIGYAESVDGIKWTRKDDEVGISKSEKGWDSEMICYPYVVTVRGKTFMFYNGNHHGQSGFGYAVLEE
jgi:predicted GH43/DUF377 family glycosyl hydrolase